MNEIEASRVIPAPREDVFRFLSRLENHWKIADRWIEVISLEAPPGTPPDTPADRGTVRILGPLGLRRTARTQVLSAEPVSSMSGRGHVGTRTRATVKWSFDERDTATFVHLAALVEAASPIDRLLLLAGGSWWLSRRFDSSLDQLAERFG